MLTRTMVIWCPDWPVRAVIHLEGMPPTAPVAVFAKSEVFACSASARAEGVCRGMRMRDAQARCPELCVFDYDETLDARAFEPVLEAVEVLSPGVQLIRPGTCAVRAKGPSRFYGGERQAAAVLAERLVALGVDDCRIGVADGPFAAEQAARRAEQQDSFVIDKDGSAAFLHDIPIGVLDRPELVSLLLRLGLRTLGALAALAARDVVTRFGDEERGPTAWRPVETNAPWSPGGRRLSSYATPTSNRRWNRSIRSPSACEAPPRRSSPRWRTRGWCARPYASRYAPTTGARADARGCTPAGSTRTT
ncbi:MAG: hypothetical protein WKF83_03535 [Nocardioidaceae bacterium]